MDAKSVRDSKRTLLSDTSSPTHKKIFFAKQSVSYLAHISLVKNTSAYDYLRVSL